MKTLVTGATGFVGATIVRELLRRGAEVRVTVRRDSDPRALDGLDVERVQADTRDPAAIKTALAGCDTLYHVAAYFAHGSLDRRRFYDVNVEGTRTVLEAALAGGLSRVVYTSTANCMGAHGAGVCADEQSAFNGARPAPHPHRGDDPQHHRLVRAERVRVAPRLTRRLRPPDPAPPAAGATARPRSAAAPPSGTRRARTCRKAW